MWYNYYCILISHYNRMKAGEDDSSWKRTGWCVVCCCCWQLWLARLRPHAASSPLSHRSPKDYILTIGIQPWYLTLAHSSLFSGRFLNFRNVVSNKQYSSLKILWICIIILDPIQNCTRHSVQHKVRSTPYTHIFPFFTNLLFILM